MAVVRQGFTVETLNNGFFPSDITRPQPWPFSCKVISLAGSNSYGVNRFSEEHRVRGS